MNVGIKCDDNLKLSWPTFKLKTEDNIKFVSTIKTMCVYVR